MFQLTDEYRSVILGEIESEQSDKMLILVRGIPGLGKSTLGKAISQSFSGIQIENDMQFMVGGEYVFDPAKLEDAHAATQSEVHNLLSDGAACVVVSNTFTKEWEMAPYRLMATKYGYKVIIVDLLLAVKRQAQQRNQFFNVGQFLDFLTTSNVHGVPPDKIHSMYDRYEYSSEPVTIVSAKHEAPSPLPDAPTVALTVDHPSCEFHLLDTGYFLALDLTVPEAADRPHSAIYQRCIDASHQLLQVFGVQCGYRMLRKLTARNASSHGLCYAARKQANITGKTNANPYAAVRNAAKEAAGWTRYHITLLSPTEYTALRREGSYEQFLTALREIVFDHSLAAEARLGMQQSSVTDKALFPVDALGREAGLSQEAYTTAVYLLLDPSAEPLQTIAQLRLRFGIGNNVVPNAESVGETWQPHITLAFTHNDVRFDRNDAGTWDKREGVQRWCDLSASIMRHSLAPQQETTVTDLQADEPEHSLATLLLYSEVQASFRSDQFGFTVADLKVRKGAMGDDATYRAHRYLQAHLPRGLVYLQHEGTRSIYRSVFSLRKFYGKAGVEDDGIGIEASQLNFKLQRVLAQTRTVLVMEKVNGRAASARFFVYAGQQYVIVGTKLSHVVCQVDAERQRLVMPSATSSGVDALELDEEGSEEKGDEATPTPRSTCGNSAAVEREPQAIDLIVSNVTALQSSLRWEKLGELVTWLGGRTLNGEVLDPREMHLVELQRHEWVSLCVTDFAVVGDEEGELDPSCSSDKDVARSALQNMTRLAEYTHSVPTYDSHSMEEDGKQAQLQRITDSVVHARDSEGKVLYFLDGQGAVLEMLKFKTWWYIWRRSCRELAAHLFSQYYNNTRGKKRGLDEDNTKELQIAGKIENLQRILLQMDKANPESKVSEKFTTRYAQVGDQLAQLRAEEEKLALLKRGEPTYDVTFTAQELCVRVQQKWPTKFAFFRDELGPAYGATVERVMALAQRFVLWCAARFGSDKEAFYRDFKEVFPVVWKRFLAECEVSDDLSSC